jgi:hypothetical protein
VVFPDPKSHSYCLMNIRCLFDRIDLNNLICCLPHLSFSIIVKASTKYEEFVSISNCRVALPWSYLLVWVLYFDFLPSYDSWVYHSDTHFRDCLRAKTPNQVTTERVIRKCTTLSRWWDITKSLGLNSYFNTEAFSLLHSVNEVLNASG